ncbi:MAG: Ig-like domain-containing protein [Nitrososphaerota archaeon]|nr:Ig-like domain-containing protein [Nitrososphaerota archaeon]
MRRARVAAVALLLLLGALPSMAAAGQSAPLHSPQALHLSTVPAQLPADGRSYPAVVISLRDALNQPTLSLTDILVYLSTSNSTVVTIPQTATILAGHSFVQVSVTTSTKIGSADIAATSQGLSAANVMVNTVHVAAQPASLSIYVAPRVAVQALVGPDEVFAVQLRNAAGQPASAGQNISLVITSSNSTVIQGIINASVPAGSDLYYGSMKPQAPGTATLTALAPRLSTGSVDITINPSGAKIAVSVSPATVAEGTNDSVTVSVSVLGMPVQGAAVSVFTTLGAVVPSFGSTDAAGQFVSNYVAGVPGVATVNATAYSSVIGTLTGAGTIIITSSATATTTSSGPSSIPGLSLVWPYLPIIIAVIVVVAGYAIVKTTLRRRRGSTRDEERGAQEEEPNRS